MPIQQAVRLEVAEKAGPHAVAIQIESRWGTYLILSEFVKETNIENVTFMGKFAVVCQTPEGKMWWMSVGARTLKPITNSGSGIQNKKTDFGFEKMPAVWKGNVVSQTDHEILSSTNQPEGWEQLPEQVTQYMLTWASGHQTGFPVQSIGKNRIVVDRFLLPKIKKFKLMAVRYGQA
jgi:hypothetical protein